MAFSVEKVLDIQPAILKIIGRVDGTTSKELQHEMTSIFAANHKDLILDFSEVSYISSAGIRILIEELKQLRTVGGKLFFIGLAPHIYEVFKISGLTSVFQIFDTYQDAINSLAK